MGEIDAHNKGVVADFAAGEEGIDYSIRLG